MAEFFNKFGKVKDVHLVIDKETKQPRGFGYVRYNSPEEATRYAVNDSKEYLIVYYCLFDYN